MKSILVQFRDTTFKNFALIFALCVFLVGCGSEDSANTNDKDGPVIKLNYDDPTTPENEELSYIPLAVIETKTGLQYIPTSKVTFQGTESIDHFFGSYALQYTKGDGETWAGVYFELDTALDVNNGSVITAKIYSSEPRQITLKLEPSLTELTVSHSGNGHEVLEFDFAQVMQSGDTKLTFINDALVKGTGNTKWITYIDDISQKPSLNSSTITLLYDFDDPTKIYRVGGFGGGEAIVTEAPDSSDTIRVDGKIIGYHEAHVLGQEYVNLGAEANDNVSGRIPKEKVKTPDSININALGTQHITYTAVDDSGNETSLIRFVTMVDQTPPSITFKSHKDLIVTVGITFEASLDAVTGEDTSGIDDTRTTMTIYQVIDGEKVEVGAISTSEVAHYKIEYSFTDKPGNTQVSTRNLFVRNEFNEKIDVFVDGSTNPVWVNGIMAYDQGLPQYGSCSNGDGCPNIKWKLVSDPYKSGDVLEIKHLDNNMDAGLFISAKNGVDMRGPKDETAVVKTGLLQLDIKRVSGSDPFVDIWADCGYPCAGGPSRQGPFVEDVWTRILIPISEIMEGPTSTLDLSIVKGALLFRAASIKDAVYRITNVAWLCETTCAGDTTPHTPFDWAETHELPSKGYQAPTAYDGMTLVWSDEFNGNMVNPAHWKFDIGRGANDDGWGNGELQYYREDNASVDNGMLIIEAEKHYPKLEDDIGYTSSKLLSAGLFEFKYGRVDARAVAAKGRGLWSAIWMLGANYVDVGWPRSGEIDILDTIAGTRDGIPQEAMMVNNMYWNATGSSPDDTLSLGSINDSLGSAEYWLNEPTDEGYERPLPWDLNNLPEWMAGPKLDDPATTEVEEIRPLLFTGCEGSSCIDTEGNHKTPVDVDNLPNWITNTNEWTDWIGNGGSIETFSNTFHVFSLIWDENVIIFEVDGVETNRIELTGALEEHYRQTFFLILNVAIGGNWPKAPTETTVFSDGMLVDYVRVYQADSDCDGIADHDWDGDTDLDLSDDDICD
ncbi:family 16 glycosylhydrolase [Porticoccaceae bacterium]|nr:family 16 glycosylhydrolase [Porticoccaceae bacterium]